MKKIFVIEDEKELADLLENILTEEGYETNKFYSGHKALRAIKKEAPDLILMDLMLPDLSGLQICKELKEDESLSDIPIMVLSARSDEYDILNAFNFGCSDYITKPYNEKILIARVKACLAFKSKSYEEKASQSQEANILRFEELEINPDRYEVYLKNELIDLTPLEFRLFYFLAKNLGKVYKRSQIFEKIYDNSYNTGDRAIDILVNRLRKKLKDYGPCIETIYGVGYSVKFNNPRKKILFNQNKNQKIS